MLPKLPTIGCSLIFASLHVFMLSIEKKELIEAQCIIKKYRSNCIYMSFVIVKCICVHMVIWSIGMTYKRIRSSVSALVYNIDDNAGVHTCHSMYGHKCSQAIPAIAIEACVLATKSHVLNFFEACAAIYCDCDLWEPITQVTKIISVLRKKSKAQNRNI